MKWLNSKVTLIYNAQIISLVIDMKCNIDIEGGNIDIESIYETLYCSSI
jgi:hypothetical protein